MFSKFKRNQGSPFGNNPMNQPNASDPNSFMNNYGPLPPNNYDIARLQTEIMELKRQNSEMLKRVSRIESYLGVRNDQQNHY